MTAVPAHPRRCPVALLALCGLLLATGCCPDLMVSQASPRDTLLSWQSSLCRDDVEGEYACLALDYKREIGGLPSYHIARQLLLEENPAFAFALKRADLLDRVVDERTDEGDAEASFEVGVAWATLQCEELVRQGAPGIHFYTLNRSPATRRVHANVAGTDGE